MVMTDFNEKLPQNFLLFFEKLLKIILNLLKNSFHLTFLMFKIKFEHI